ncbi:hypothetical protein B0H12DRAFT_1231927 [Mycena haematopus]|nr:hypothetical protein B0H12DRAFT_1231927 [Mycena haematopus]
MSQRLFFRSFSQRLLLSDLVPDVIFSIFAYCDISSVVSTSQTCRYLHNLAFNRSVWLGLLINLRRRSILDQTYTPNLQTLSTDEMIGSVRWLLTGPQTWSLQNLDSGSAAEISREIALYPDAVKGSNTWEYVVKLLPSGRYVLFHDWDDLECWSVADKRLIWTYVSAMERSQVLDFAMDETDSESLIIMVCGRSSLLTGGSINFVEIVSLNVHTGTHDSLLVTDLPGSAPGDVYYRPIVNGPIAAADNGDSSLMIIDWRARSYFVVQCDDDEEMGLALIPQHIILLVSSSGKDKIHLISTDALHPYWAPIIDIGVPAEFSPISVEDIPKLSTIENNDTEQSFVNMYVHESPVRDGEYRVWIHCINSEAHSAGLLSYRLSIPNNRDPQWYLRSWSGESGYSSGFALFVSYSGHAYADSGILSATSLLETVPVGEDFVIDLDITAYSGAVTYFTEEALVI